MTDKELNKQEWRNATLMGRLYGLWKLRGPYYPFERLIEEIEECVDDLEDKGAPECDDAVQGPLWQSAIDTLIEAAKKESDD